MPMSMSLSPNGVLAVAMGACGIQVYALVPQLGEKPGFGQTLASVREGHCSYVRFIANSESNIGLISRCSRDGADRIMVHGAVCSTVPKSTEMINVSQMWVTAIDASPPGNIAVLLAGANMLHVLQPSPDTPGTFKRQSINLLQFAASRTGGGHMAPVSVAISTECVAIGYAAILHGGNGLVEVLSLINGCMLARRAVLGGTPSGLITSGLRVLVGSESRYAECNRMYMFHVSEPESYALAQGEEAWSSEAMTMGRASYCFAHRHVGQATLEWGVVSTR